MNRLKRIADLVGDARGQLTDRRKLLDAHELCLQRDSLGNILPDFDDLVRAVAPPFPGAFSGSLRINRTKIEEGKKPSVRGPYRENGEWFAGCGDGKVLRLLEVQESK